MQEANNLRVLVETWDVLLRRTTDSLELLALAEDDPAMLAELENETAAIGRARNGNCAQWPA